MRNPPEARDPDLDEVFAELRRQDAEEERALELPPSPKLPPIRPLEELRDDESPEEWRAREAEAKRAHVEKYGYKEPGPGETMSMLEDSNARLKKALDRSSGSAAVDAARQRVYSASLALQEFMKAKLAGATPNFERIPAIMIESHAAFDALWLARLEHLRTTCAPEMRAKVDKAIAWQKRQSAS